MFGADNPAQLRASPTDKQGLGPPGSGHLIVTTFPDRVPLLIVAELSLPTSSGSQCTRPGV